MCKKLFTFLLMAVMLFETAFASTTAVLTKQAKLYTKASTKSNVYCTLSKGDTVTVLETSGSIAKVQYSGKTLFMAKSALKKTPAVSSPKSAATPSSSVVRMTTLSDAKAYKSKSSSSKSVSVKKGSTLSVYEIDGKWYKINKNGSWYYLPSSAFEADKTVTKKTERKTAVYKDMSSNSLVLGTVSTGTKLTILEESGSWFKVKKGSSIGWVPASAFEEAAAPVVNTKKVLCAAKVYKNSSASSSVLGSVRVGTVLTVLEESDSWVKVQKGASVGWVSASVFETPVPEPAETTSTVQKRKQPDSYRDSARVEQVIDAAMDKLGLPYVFSSTGPYSYDCSGLTLYAFRRVGISLAHSAYTQGYGASTRLTMEQLQRGDLVFFNTNRSDGDMCDHVGIYIGNGRFIHASSGKGKVIISELTTGYYAGVFSWGRQLL